MGRNSLIGDNLMFKLILLSLILFRTSPAAITEVPQPMDKLYIPEGYDSNDSIQLVAAGEFKNSCYQTGIIQSKVNASKNEITLALTAYLYEGRCLKVEVPFFQTVYLGRINKSGNYKIKDGYDGRLLGNIRVGKPSEEGSGTDNTSYATITDAFIIGNELHLRGLYSNTCLQVKDIEVRYQKDVLVVLPQLEFLSSSSCAKTELPFELKKTLTDALPEKFLLHVRSMGGQAVNKIVIRE